MGPGHTSLGAELLSWEPALPVGPHTAPPDLKNSVYVWEERLRTNQLGAHLSRTGLGQGEGQRQREGQGLGRRARGKRKRAGLCAHGLGCRTGTGDAGQG